MKLKFSIAWDVLAGMLTWFLVFALTLYLSWPHERLWSLWPWVIPLFLLNGACFYCVTRSDERSGVLPRFELICYILQLLFALALNWILPFDYLAILSIIWVSVLPYLLPMRTAVFITVAVLGLWYGVDSYIEQRSMWITALLFSSFHFFALLMKNQARSEQQARQELQQTHQQLLATQDLLMMASQQQERSRIARDLHDVLGHHLTALTINLQVAGHLTQGEAKTKVDQCHQIARLLLSDVREAVSALREQQQFSIYQALEKLLIAVPGVKVQWDCPQNVELADVKVAQQLLLIVQEALTNTLRHSQATEFYLAVKPQHGFLQLTIYDNGKVSPDWKAGNGLTGMQERVASCAGTLVWQVKDNHFCLEVTLPTGIQP
ncbi:sensor histidine kinase [Rheinheimera soli]|uniref:Signal transduction histidine kinase n=1 Tax=Rheinheimera soli TaxID=443616 RepID=A0ABU1VZN3_9GAMM|nr:sensor histidine kinase [Rheinheimera soli]MDR7120918.1 signal transduction histidine kinase [Rheinheimera soli]